MTTATGPQIFECAQYSSEWWQLRRGIPTSSRFDRVLTPGTGKPSAQQEDFIAELIAERVHVTDEYTPFDDGVWPSYQNDEMAEGLRREPEARAWYSMERDADLRLVGFVLSECGRFGCSPDALVGEDGGLELKNPAPKTHLKYLLRGGLPQEYKCQVHGSLIVTGRAYWSFMSYCPGFPPLLVDVRPDEFTDKLRDELERFHERYQQTLARFNELNVGTIFADERERLEQTK